MLQPEKHADRLRRLGVHEAVINEVELDQTTKPIKPSPDLLRRIMDRWLKTLRKEAEAEALEPVS